MASQTRATPGVYARDRSSRLDSETVGLIDIFPCLCRSKTGSAARAGSSSKLKKDTVTPHGSSLTRCTCAVLGRECAPSGGADGDHPRKQRPRHGYAPRFLDTNVADRGAGSSELTPGP